MPEPTPEFLDSFLVDALALKHKYRMSDVDYAGAVAGWFLAFCKATGRDPVAHFQAAMDACSEKGPT